MTGRSVAHKPDDVLLRDLGSLVQRDRSNLVELLVHITETDARGLYRAAAYPNMYQYCLGELHLSEDEAGKRIRVARATREFPLLLEMLADGRLHLSGALTLAPHLTPDTVPGLLEAAVHKTRAEIEQLLADRAPKPDVATTLKLVHAQNPAVMLRPESANQLPGNRPAGAAHGAALPDVIPSPLGTSASAHSPAPGRVDPPIAPATTCPPAPPPARDRLAPLGTGRYELRTTLDQEAHDLLRQLQALLAHAVPGGEIPELLKRALRLAVRGAERRRPAATSRPGQKRRSKNARHIPAAVRRAVHTRDQGRCTFVSSGGRRCAEKRFLQYDHVHPVARGGQSTVANVRLRCRAHNQYDAERTYGAGFMREKRLAASMKTDTASMLRGVAAERARMRVGDPVLETAEARAPQ